MHERGVPEAYIYGDESILGGLNSFYLLVDEPKAYGLPAAPKMPTRNLFKGSTWAAIGAIVVGFLGIVTLRNRRRHGTEPVEADPVAEGQGRAGREGTTRA